MTNLMTSGEKKSLQDRIDEVEKELSAYNNRIGLRLQVIPEEIQYYLNLSKDELNSLHPEDIAIGAALLSKHAIFIQKEYNRFSRQINWLDSNLLYTIADQLPDASGNCADERKLWAINHNDVAKKIRLLITKNQSYLDELKDVANLISYYSKSLKDLQTVKTQIRRSN